MNIIFTLAVLIFFGSSFSEGVGDFAPLEVGNKWVYYQYRQFFREREQEPYAVGGDTISVIVIDKYVEPGTAAEGESVITYLIAEQKKFYTWDPLTEDVDTLAYEWNYQARETEDTISCGATFPKCFWVKRYVDPSSMDQSCSFSTDNGGEIAFDSTYYDGEHRTLLYRADVGLVQYSDTSFFTSGGLLFVCRRRLISFTRNNSVGRELTRRKRTGSNNHSAPKSVTDISFPNLFVHFGNQTCDLFGRIVPVNKNTCRLQSNKTKIFTAK